MLAFQTWSNDAAGLSGLSLIATASNACEVLTCSPETFTSSLSPDNTSVLKSGSWVLHSIPGTLRFSGAPNFKIRVPQRSPRYAADVVIINGKNRCCQKPSIIQLCNLASAHSFHPLQMLYIKSNVKRRFTKSRTPKSFYKYSITTNEKNIMCIMPNSTCGCSQPPGMTKLELDL